MRSSHEVIHNSCGGGTFRAAGHLVPSLAPDHVLFPASARMFALRFAKPCLRALPAQRLAGRSSTVRAMATRVHFDSTSCPYAQRSWIALLEKGLPFEIRKVDLANKDAEFVEMYHSINPDPEAPAKVPILIDGDTKLIESNIIVEYLEAQYPEPPLLPADAAAAARVRLFVETFGSQFTPNLFALFRADTPEGVEAGKAKLAAALKVLDAFLLQHGSQEGGDLFLGGSYSMAETCCTGFLQRALAMLPHYRGIDLWAVTREAKADRLERWMRAALARPSAQKTKPADDVIVGSMAKFVVPMKE